jgi:hypothetical protein
MKNENPFFSYLYQFCRSDWLWEGEAPAEPGFVVSGNNAKPVTHYVLRFTFYYQERYNNPSCDL